MGRWKMYMPDAGPWLLVGGILLLIQTRCGWLNSDIATMTRLCGYCAWLDGHGLGPLALAFGVGAAGVGAAGAVGPGSDGGMGGGSNVGRNDSTTRGPGAAMPDSGGSNVGRNDSTKAPDPWDPRDAPPSPTPVILPDNRPQWTNSPGPEAAQRARDQQQENEKWDAIREGWQHVYDEMKLHSGTPGNIGP